MKKRKANESGRNWEHKEHPEHPGLLSPTQAIKKYPELRQIRWNEITLGRLRSDGLIPSWHDKVHNIHYLYEEALLDIMEFYNLVQEKRKLKIVRRNA